MAEPFLSFRQSVSLGGYRWRNFVAEGLVPKGKPVLFWDAKADQREYDPLHDEPTLFLKLADTEPEPDALLAFANQYGKLGRDVAQPSRQVFDRPAGFGYARGSKKLPGNLQRTVETLSSWQEAVRWLRHLTTVWRHAEKRERGPLGQIFLWKNRGIVAHGFPPYPGKALRRDRVKLLQIWAEQAGVPPGDVIGIAFLHIQAALNIGALTQVSPRLRWNKAEQKTELTFSPRSLWSAILVQFAEAVAGQRAFQRCAGCSRWFELAPGVNRSDRLTCSDSCRQRYYRRRKEQAVGLHEQGKTPREIAEQLGSDVKTVKGWINRPKEQ